MRKRKEIEIYSEEVNDILSRPPRWIISWGISLIFIIFVVIVSGSAFFHYPEIISAPITISSRNLPVHLKARTSGKIVSLFVGDSARVVPGVHLVLFESTTNYKDYLKLEKDCREFKDMFKKNNLALQWTFTDNLQLGNLQPYYTALIKSMEDYKSFINADYHSKKTSMLNKQLEEQRYILDLGEKQLKGVIEQYFLEKSVFGRDSLLFVQGVLSQADFEQSRIKRLTSHQTLENMRTTIANMRLGIFQSEQSIFELKRDKEERQQQYVRTLAGNFDNLNSQMADWLQTYILESPINGIVSYSRFWQENQNVLSGDVVLTIIPQEGEGVTGKLYLTLQGTGKVKKGQKVNIKLDNFPYMEYGMLEGRVKKISSVPVEVDGVNKIAVDVELIKGLTSDYGLLLNSGEIMSGSADIITEEMSLLKRLINPLRHLIKSRVI